MKLRVIPFSTVEADIASIKARQDTSHPSSRSQRFSTASHELSEIIPNVPETSDFKHEIPPWKPYHYTPWLPLIARSQHMTDYHVFEIPTFLYEDLMRLISGWVATGRMNDRLVDDAVDTWLSLKTEGTSRILECLDGKKRWFIRLDQMSPKDSPLGGKDPSSTLRDVIVKLCSSMRAYGAMQREKAAANEEGRSLVLKLALNPWNDDMDAGKEFRVFVPPPIVRGREPNPKNMEISAISQYRWPIVFEPASGKSVQQTAEIVHEGAKKVLTEIIAHAESELDPEIIELLVKYGLTFDVGLHGDEIQLIEINPFGALSGCGGSLFNWALDAKAMYGLENDVTFMVTLETWKCIAIKKTSALFKLAEPWMVWAREKFWAKKVLDETDDEYKENLLPAPGSADFVQQMKRRHLLEG